MFRFSAGKRLFSPRLVPIVLAAVGFFATYFLRQGTGGIPGLPDEGPYVSATKAPQPGGQGRNSVASGATVPQPAAVSSPAQSRSASASLDRSQAAVSDPAAAFGPTDAPSQPTAAQSEVPVVFTLQEAPDQTEPRAILQNQSTEPLHLDVTSSNAVTGNQSQVQVVVPARRKANLTSAGLIVESGNQIRIHSEPYRDQVFKVE